MYIDKIYSNDFSLFLKLSGINPLLYKICLIRIYLNL